MGPLDFADPFDVGVGDELPELDYGFGTTAGMDGDASIFGGDLSAASYRPAPEPSIWKKKRFIAMSYTSTKRRCKNSVSR